MLAYAKGLFSHNKSSYTIFFFHFFSSWPYFSDWTGIERLLLLPLYTNKLFLSVLL